MRQECKKFTSRYLLIVKIKSKTDYSSSKYALTSSLILRTGSNYIKLSYLEKWYSAREASSYHIELTGVWNMRSIISTNLVLFIITLYCLTIGACGGGGSSSEDYTPTVSDISNPSSPMPKKSPKNPKQAPKKPNSSSSPPKTLANLIEVNPLRDLGLGKGESICFRLKSYNNVTESDFSKSVCGQIKNDHSLILTWNNIPGNIVGYYVYFSKNKNNTNSNFLTNVIKS